MSDAIWDFQIGSQRRTPFEIWGSFAAFRPLRVCVFDRLSIYLSIDYSHIVLIIAIWPGDRIRRPEHSTVEHGSCDESV